MTNFEKITRTTASLAQTIAGARYMGVGYVLEGLEEELTKNRELFTADQYDYLLMILGVQRLRNGLKQESDLREWNEILYSECEEIEK